MSLNYGFWAQVAIMSLGAVGALLRAFVLATCWRWFAAPLGLPVLGWAHAYGVGLLVNLAALTMPHVGDKEIAEGARAVERDATAKEKRLRIITQGVQALVPSALVLAIAYVAHLAMGTS